MALSKTHLGALFTAVCRTSTTLDEAIKVFKALVPYAVLPDAIRCFVFYLLAHPEDATRLYKMLQDKKTAEAARNEICRIIESDLMKKVPNNRVLSHSEIASSGIASGMRFPTPAELKILDEVIIAALPKHYEDSYHQVAIGDETCIQVFESYNQGLDPLEYLGIMIHLTQDRIYDAYIREVIDCSKRHETGEFYFDGTTYDAKSVRAIIGQIEECEFRALVKMIKQETGVDFNKEFFEATVKPAFDAAYCPKMAETTWKYISFSDQEIPALISEDQARGIMNQMIDATAQLLLAK